MEVASYQPVWVVGRGFGGGGFALTCCDTQTPTSLIFQRGACHRLGAEVQRLLSEQVNFKHRLSASPRFTFSTQDPINQLGVIYLFIYFFPRVRRD